MNIYGLCVGIWTVSEILSSFWSEQGGASLGMPWWSSRSVLLNVSYYMIHDINLNHMIYGLGVGIWKVSQILSILWVEGGRACHCGTSQSVLLNAYYYKKYEFYIWFRGGNQNGFWDIKPFMCEGGGTCLGTPLGTSRSVLLSVFYNKE